MLFNVRSRVDFPIEKGLFFKAMNFTVTGQWRTVDREAHEPIDAGSTLVTGTPVNGPVALRNALLARPDQFPQAVTEKLMMYAIGRKLA